MPDFQVTMTGRNLIMDVDGQRGRSRCHGQLIITVLAAVAAGCERTQITHGDPPTVQSATLVQTIGSFDGDDALSAVGDVLLLRGGLIAVAQPMADHIIVFNTKGERVQTIGRTGKGPGEFQSIAALGTMNGSIYVADAGTGRVTFFSNNGSLQGLRHQVSKRITHRGVTYIPTPPQVLTADGSGLLEPRWVIRLPAPPMDSLLSPVVRVDSTGGVMDTLYWRALPRPLLIDNGRFAIQNPYDNLPLHVILRDGSGVATIDRHDGQQFSITRLDAFGNRLFRRSYAQRPQPLQDYVVECNLEFVRFAALRAGVGYGNMRLPDAGTLRQGLAEHATPDSQPIVYDAVGTQGGSIWLRREVQSDGVSRWSRVDSHGDLRNDIELACTEGVVAFDGAILITLSFSVMDTPILKMYTLDVGI